jgi:CrcB protein
MPVGTAAVNLIGAFALGMIVGVGQAPTGWLLAAAGFTAGFTTFSTWMVETARLGLFPRPSMRSTANLVVLAMVGVLCAALGYYVMN